MYCRGVVVLAYPAPALTDGVVRLRPWTDDDLPCVQEAATDAAITSGTSVPVLFTREEGRAFIDRQRQRIEREEGISLAIAETSTDTARGLVWLAVRPQPGVMGLGYWLVRSARGQGLGARAARLATEWALRQAGAARIEAWVEPNNLASQRLLSAVGFTREGILRSFLSFGARRADAVVFSRISQDEA